MSTDALTPHGRRRARVARASAIVALLVLVPRTGSAAAAGQPRPADRATARALAYAGQRALDRKDYKVALDRFTRANNLVPAPTLALRIARAQVGLGRLVEAQETYRQILRTGVAPGSPAVFRQAVESARREGAALAPRLGWVTIRIRGPEAPDVTLDGTRVPAAELGVRRAVDPGTHVVRVTARGYQPLESTFRIGEGQRRSVGLTPTRAPATRRADRGGWHETAGFTALGVGAAGLIVGGVAGVVAMSKHSQLDKACPGRTCPPDQRSELDSYRTAGTLSTVGFVVAGVGCGAGITLLLTRPDPAGSAYVAPFVGPGTLGAKGRF